MSANLPLTVVLGGLSGAIGAVLLGQLGHAPAPAPTAQVAAEPSRPVIVPPGWDAILNARVSSLENRVDDLSVARTAAAQASAAPAPPHADPPAARERERIEQYDKELATLDRLLGEHARETVDRAWLGPQSEAMERFLSDGARGRPVEVKGVDCRDRTCVATLAFPHPMDALGYLQTAHLAAPGCRGFSAIPTPPADDGPYELSIHYNCR
jgi:hypothetical protein